MGKTCAGRRELQLAKSQGYDSAKLLACDPHGYSVLRAKKGAAGERLLLVPNPDRLCTETVIELPDWVHPSATAAVLPIPRSRLRHVTITTGWQEHVSDPKRRRGHWRTEHHAIRVAAGLLEVACDWPGEVRHIASRPGHGETREARFSFGPETPPVLTWRATSYHREREGQLENFGARVVLNDHGRCQSIP